MKKNNKGISSIVIILIVAIILIAIIGIIYFCFSKKDNATGGIGDLFLEKEDTNITYDLEFAGRWGDPNLGISYLVPYHTIFKTNSSKIYPNGQQFNLPNYDTIFIETLLDDSTDVSLNNLASEIMKQKSSEYYSYYTPKEHSEINISSSKECLIDDLKTIYYEGSFSDEYYEYLTIGYSFIFNGKKINVHANSHNNALDIDKQYLIKIIQSMQKYDGQLFSEINEDEYDFSSIFYTNSVLEVKDKIYSMSIPHLNQDSFYRKYTPTFCTHINSFSLYATISELNSEELYFNNVSKEELLKSENPIRTILEKGESKSTSDKLEIVKEEDFNVSGINMKKTVVVEYQYVKEITTDKYSIKFDLDDNTLYPILVTTYYSFTHEDNVFYMPYTNPIYNTSSISKTKLEERPTQEEMDKKKEIAQLSSERIMDTLIRSLIIK